MQKSEFPKMRHYVGFWQIGSQIIVNALKNYEIHENFDSQKC